MNLQHNKSAAVEGILDPFSSLDPDIWCITPDNIFEEEIKYIKLEAEQRPAQEMP